MKKIKTSKTRFAAFAVATSCVATGALAGGIDLSGQDIGLLFERGNVARASLGFSSPTLSGTFIGANTGDIGVDRMIPFAGIKWDQSDTLSFAVTYDQPWGGGVKYKSSVLAGTDAYIDSHSVNVLARYKFNANWSVHGGLRIETLGARLSSPASAAPLIPSYNLSINDSTNVGAVIGVAWENPARLQRISLTYNSRVSHSHEGSESSNVVAGGAPQPTSFDVQTPQSINLAFQTALSPTLITFAKLRWVDWSEYEVPPPLRTAVFGAPLDSYPGDSTTWEVGLVKVFNPKFFGVLTVGGDSGNDRPLPSGLAPFDGYRSYGLAGVFNVNEKVTVTAGMRYLKLGDDSGNGLAFSDNSVLGLGVSMDYRF